MAFATPLRMGETEAVVGSSDFTSSDGRKRYRGGKFRLLWDAVGCGGDGQAAAASLPVEGAGGPDSLQTSPPVRRLDRAAGFSALRPFGPYIAGRRPATPQSPERLRSTPFDCVAIAPCCFAFRKAVLSHALAALTALYGARAKPGGRRSRR